MSNHWFGLFGSEKIIIALHYLLRWAIRRRSKSSDWICAKFGALGAQKCLLSWKSCPIIFKSGKTRFMHKKRLKYFEKWRKIKKFSERKIKKISERKIKFFFSERKKWPNSSTDPSPGRTRNSVEPKLRRLAGGAGEPIFNGRRFKTCPEIVPKCTWTRTRFVRCLDRHSPLSNTRRRSGRCTDSTGIHARSSAGNEKFFGKWREFFFA